MDNGHKQAGAAGAQKCLERDYGQEDLRRLLSFYLACIEEEDLRSLTLRLSQLHRSFLSPWEGFEPLFHPNASEVRFETKHKADRSLLLRGVIQAGEPQRLFYGYPVFLDHEDNIAPLFFTEVEARQIQDNQFVMRPVDPEGIQFNHHFLRLQGAQLEEVQKIQEYLERPFGSFAARLKAASEYMGLTLPEQDPGRLDTFMGKGMSRGAWCNRPILFRSERSVYTAQLRLELSALSRYPNFLKAAMSTSVGSILGPRSKDGAQNRGRPSTNETIEIRPLNMSQEAALQSGFTAPLTVITGPPGTGKSQVVVNLLANAVIRGESVLFASKNSKAVDVVRDWLRQILGPDQDWTMRVGNLFQMEESRAEMTSRLGRLAGSEAIVFPPEKKNGILESHREIASIRTEIEAIQQKLRRLIEAMNERREAETLVPNAWVAATPANAELIEDTSLLHQLTRETEALEQGKGLGLRLWLLRLVLGARLIDRYFAKLEMTASELPGVIREEVEQLRRRGPSWYTIAQEFRKLHCYGYWLHCCHRANDILSDLTGEEDASVLLTRIDKLKDRRAALSQEMLRTSWTNRIASEQGRIHLLVRQYFDLSEKLRHVGGREEWIALRADFMNICRQLLDSFPVWIVTSLSARRALPLDCNLFDVAVIDEASQCDIASALPILFRAKRAVIIGDPNQLRHISALSLKEELDIAQVTGAASLIGDWSYTSNSLYHVSEAAAVRAGGGTILLAEHYRSHPDIIEFSNRTFYARSLVLRTRIAGLAERLGKLDLGLFWHPVSGAVPNTRRSACNEAEITRIVEICTQWAEAGLLGHSELTLGIVTPFRLQADRIEEAVRNQPWFETLRDRITVGTAHRFQGDEADLVFFSPVISQGIDARRARWVADTDQLLNVAITRARGALHVVGNAEACQKAGGALGEFAEYALGSGRTPNDGYPFESPAEEKLAELLGEAGLWYHPQYREGRYSLDFSVVSPFGTRYDLEVDGVQHWSAEQLSYDQVRDQVIQEAGYMVIRLHARDILSQPEKVRYLLSRLV